MKNRPAKKQKPAKFQMTGKKHNKKPGAGIPELTTSGGIVFGPGCPGCFASIDSTTGQVEIMKEQPHNKSIAREVISIDKKGKVGIGPATLSVKNYTG